MGHNQLRQQQGTPVAKPFHGHTRVRSLGTKDRGEMGRGLAKQASLMTLERKERKKRQPLAGHKKRCRHRSLNSKKPGTEERKTCHPNRQMCSLRVKSLLQRWGREDVPP